MSPRPVWVAPLGTCCEPFKPLLALTFGVSTPFQGQLQIKQFGGSNTAPQPAPPLLWDALMMLFLCVSSSCKGHANLFCIMPILTDGSRREFGFVPTLSFNLASCRAVRDAGAPNLSPERAANLQHSPGRI